MIQFGNNVSPDTETKTRRNWKPNVLSKSLYSVALKKKIKLRVTAKVLKTMDREGGLDEYLLKDSEHRLKELGPLGWALRWTLLQKPEVIARMRAEAAALGVDQATIDAQWPTQEMQAQAKATFAYPIRALDLVGEEQEDETTGLIPSRSKKNQVATILARKEYARAEVAVQKFLEKGFVDSEEEGLKLFFIRQKELRDQRKRFKELSDQENKEKFSDAIVREIRHRLNMTVQSDAHVRRVAFQEWVNEAKQTGEFQTWAQSKAAAGEAAHAAQVQKAGGEAAYKTMLRNKFAALIQEAETASTNEALDASQREYLENAINKADRMIKAKASGGVDTYVDLMLEDLASTPNADGLVKPSKKETQASGDAWGAVVNANNNVAEKEVHA